MPPVYWGSLIVRTEPRGGTVEKSMHVPYTTGLLALKLYAMQSRSPKHTLAPPAAPTVPVRRFASASARLTFCRANSELQVATMKVKFAPLQLIIEMKEIADRPKDRAVLPLMRAALDETQD